MVLEVGVEVGSRDSICSCKYVKGGVNVRIDNSAVWGVDQSVCDIVV